MKKSYATLESRYATVVKNTFWVKLYRKILWKTIDFDVVCTNKQ